MPAAVFALVLAAPASATPQEEQQGSRLLQELEAGQLKCSEASAADFELVGEYAMGRTFGSPAQHEAMNQMMSRMMGSGGEEAVHETMGRRFSGCGGGRLPQGFGQMMGAAYGENDEGFDGPSAGAMIGMMAVLIGAVALSLLLLARWRPGGPLETLKRRYASGELSADEYQERRRLLEGS
ncbi:MAG TPA: SHOCT domain-containing protein [Solirubrobacterales bacterium]